MTQELIESGERRLPRMRVVGLLRGLLTIALATALTTTSARAQSGASGSSPNGNSSPASASESFKTNQFTGAMTTSFPIPLPPGTNGLTPTLVIDYNSHRGNGWIGQGWDLAFPAIRIDPRIYSGNPYDDIRYLIGDDRLVRADNGFYRRAIDDFVRFELVDDEGYGFVWIAHGTDGSTTRYEPTPDAPTGGPDSITDRKSVV